MQDRAVVVKLGGSVLSDEVRERSFVKAHIAAIAGEMAPYRGRVVAVSGGGWMVHKLAKSLISSSPIDCDLLSSIKLELMDLSLKIARCLHDQGLRPVILDPMELDRLQGYRTDGLTPLVHPGVELDGAGVKIISGDDIVVEIAKELRAEMVVFVTDMDYIYRYKGDGREMEFGEEITELTQEIFKTIDFRKKSELDVTGEMGHKAEMMLELSRSGISSCVVNGLKKRRVLRAIEGEVEGTICR